MYKSFYVEGRYVLQFSYKLNHQNKLKSYINEYEFIVKKSQSRNVWLYKEKHVKKDKNLELWGITSICFGCTHC